MKKFIITLPVLAAVLLAGCSKEMAEPVEVPEIETVKTVLRVGLVPEVKTYMGESEDAHRHVYWSSGDEIAVNGAVSDALAEVDPETAQAEFTFDGVLSAPYKIVYPASVYTDASHVTLPAVQKYAKDGFASGMFPMVAYSAEGSMDITLRSLCAILRVSVKRAVADPDTDNIVSVRFKGRNNEQVSGAFAVDYENAVLTGTSSAKEDKEVKVVKSLSTSTAEPCVYYLVVPAGTYSNGFDVVVKDASGHIMTKSKTASKTLEAGHQYDMAEFEFVPTATEIGIEISSAQQLVEFAEDYNNKKFEGGEPIVVGLTADIAFDATSSAAFNAAGGIGLKNNLYGASEDYYFNGNVCGENHTISGLEATVPIFAAIGEGGAVSDLIIDNTCSFSFTHPDSAELDAGALVGYNKGIVKNIDVAADVSLAAGEVSQVTALGGVAGRVTVGTLNGCVYSGNISVPDGFIVDANKIYVGGIAGSITNAAGKVTICDFKGTIDFAGTVASTDKTNPYLCLGGVVGNVAAGTVSDCYAWGDETKSITMDNDKSYTATIQNHSRKVYHLAQGGIVGMNAGAVSDCTNEASISNFILSTGTKGGKAADGNSRYYDLGGIVGLNLAEGTVSGCTNNAPFETRCTPRIQKIGGVVGYNKGTVSSSTNTEFGTIYITTTNISPYSLRVGEVGGVIGNNEGSVSNLQNAGDISMDRTENAAGVELKFGGVIGLTTKTIDGGGSKNISNSGNISDLYNGTTVTTAGLRFGGVVGSAQASVLNVSNTGSLLYKTSSTNVVSWLYMGGVAGEIRGAASAVVSGCENSGEVNFNAEQNGKHTENCIGGIIGKTVTYSVTKEETEEVTVYPCNVDISNCTNSGYIHGGNPTKQNGTSCYVGGIVAYLDGISSIEDCTNSGNVYNNQFSNSTGVNNTAFGGGIAGWVSGTEENPISISGSKHTSSDLSHRRGYSGGIVGYANYTSLQNNDVLGINFAGSAYFIGGVAGWIVNTTIKNCKVTGTSITSSQSQRAGGIVAKLGDASTLDACSSNINSMTGPSSAADGINYKYGAVAGESVAGSTIKNCHWPASGSISGGGTTHAWQICSDANFTDGGGNVADL